MGYSCVFRFLKRKIYFSVAHQDALSAGEKKTHYYYYSCYYTGIMLNNTILKYEDTISIHFPAAALLISTPSKKE